jgi:hypothetical protein
MGTSILQTRGVSTTPPRFREENRDVQKSAFLLLVAYTTNTMRTTWMPLNCLANGGRTAPKTDRWDRMHLDKIRPIELN